jgi:hypothetical protein
MPERSENENEKIAVKKSIVMGIRCCCARLWMTSQLLKDQVKDRKKEEGNFKERFQPPNG